MTYPRRAFLKTSVAASAARMTDVPVATPRRKVRVAGAPAGAQSPALFPGFVTQKIKTSGATIHAVRGGSGPPLLLLHGYPQTHVTDRELADNSESWHNHRVSSGSPERSVSALFLFQ